MAKDSRKKLRYIIRPTFQIKDALWGGVLLILAIIFEVFLSPKIIWLFPGILIYSTIYFGNIATHALITRSERAQRYKWQIIQVGCYIYFGLIASIILILNCLDIGFSFKISVILGFLIGQGGWVVYKVIKKTFEFLLRLSIHNWIILFTVLLAIIIGIIWLVQGKSPIQIELHANAIEICIETPSYQPGIIFNPCIDIPIVLPQRNIKPSAVPIPTIIPTLQPKAFEEICNPQSIEPPIVTISNLAAPMLNLTLIGIGAPPPMSIPGMGTIETMFLPGVYEFTGVYVAPNVTPATGSIEFQLGCTYTWKFWIGP